jgi:mRNA interferase RelE/StbE
MYKILLSKGTEKILTRLKKTNARLFNQMIRGIDRISGDPYCAKPLSGDLKGYYSYRVREYRIIFDIAKRKHIVHIEKIEHRRDVYR